jgi:trehalose 6-phosphate phosphatase
VAGAERLRLFLDYDGTLADFAPTPEHVLPDPELIALLDRLAGQPRLRLAIVSGRRLSHIQRLVPVPGVLLAGTYGIELQTPEGQRIDRLDYDRVRPTLAALKPQWAALISGRQGYFLEDKDWALALHARFAEEDESRRVLEDARGLARAALSASAPGLFRLLGGHKFLEAGPQLAHKGLTVAHLLDEHPWPGAVPLYLGDDDKDEEAFGVIHARGGIAVMVAAEPRPSEADLRLASPQAVRRWLEALLVDGGRLE